MAEQEDSPTPLPKMRRVSSRLQTLWQAVFETAKAKNIAAVKIGEKFDGLAFWHGFKDLANTCKAPADMQFRPDLPSEVSRERRDAKDDPTGGKVHFQFQTVDLHRRGLMEPSLKLLLQFALNAGQDVGVGGENLSWYNINTYVDECNQELLEKNITDEIYDGIMAYLSA
mmetsp:Transcript_68911/g.109335  ORF Transcript_68911/g.109335 Transcript_68911/m.109335 type:complete len:170 (+) Transcript_68911:54-563(+)